MHSLSSPSAHACSEEREEESAGPVANVLRGHFAGGAPWVAETATTAEWLEATFDAEAQGEEEELGALPAGLEVAGEDEGSGDLLGAVLPTGLDGLEATSEFPGADMHFAYPPMSGSEEDGSVDEPDQAGDNDDSARSAS